MLEEPKILKIIRGRYSVRSYADRPVEDEKLNLILEAARLAPSASNSQPWHFYVVRDKKKIGTLSGKMPIGSQIVINSFIAQAPVVVVATAGPVDFLHRVASFIINKRWYYVDVAIALEHMVLTAWELGIGSCWVGWFDEKKIRSFLNIAKNEEVIAMLTLGYPGEGSVFTSKIRKSMKEIVKFID